MMTDKQYFILLDVYNELHEVFKILPFEIQQAFYVKLHKKNGFKSLKVG